MPCSGARAREILGDLYAPEFRLKAYFHSAYENAPFQARVALGSIATFSGFIKPLLIPLISALGLILMPILAAVKMEAGDVEGTKGYLQAWGVCFLGTLASVTLVALIGYTLPLLWTGVILVLICSLSILCHVVKALQEPNYPNYSN